MADKETLQEILNSIDEFAQRANITRDKAFAAWYAVNFYAIDEDEALEAASADGGNDQGIDIVFVDEASEAMIVLQAHCPQNTNKKTQKAKWDATVASLPFVKKPESLKALGREDLAQQLESAKDDHRQLSLTIGLISLGLRSEEISNSVAVTKETDTEVSYFYSDQDEIVNQYRAIMLDGGGIPQDKIQFVESYFEDRGEYGRAVIGAVSASELQRLHKAYPQELFAGNIRFFLGARKGGINEQIIKTAKSSPGTFWALNNGITIVADTIEPFDIDNIKGVTATRFSIVNGCQTTSSLVHADAPSSAKVLGV